LRLGLEDEEGGELRWCGGSIEARNYFAFILLQRGEGRGGCGYAGAHILFPMLEVFLNPPPLSPISFLPIHRSLWRGWFSSDVDWRYGRGRRSPLFCQIIPRQKSQMDLGLFQIIFPAEIVDNALKRMLPPF